MKILGIGTDLVEVERIRAMLERHEERFIARVFTAGEQAYCRPMSEPAPYYAARFAAKEAVSKACGTGIGAAISWLDIEVQRDEAGKPSIVLSGAGAETAAALGVTKIMVSLSHTHNYATAQVLLLGE